MSNTDKRNQIQQTNEKKLFTRKEQDLQLKQQLLLGPEQLLSSKGTDENLEKLYLKIQLTSGVEFTLADYISEHLIEYHSRFYKEYYYQVAKLLNLEKEAMNQFHKPQCVAMFTIQFIYGRFPNKVLNELRRKCPYVLPGVRKNKLFQFLSPSASEQLDLFIDQAVALMQECETLSQFKLRYSKQYKVYIQLDMFED
jgi:hypothetical protein